MLVGRAVKRDYAVNDGWGGRGGGAMNTESDSHQPREAYIQDLKKLSVRVRARERAGLKESGIIWIKQIFVIQIKN
jgi:hypothetical protein